MPSNARIIRLVIAASVSYATLRYNVFKGVPWTDWPVYILNKALALSALFLLVAWVLRARRDPGAYREDLWEVAWRLVLIHVSLSLALYGAAYFPAFFFDGRLTWQAGVSLLAGAIAAGGAGAIRAPHGHPAPIRLVGGLMLLIGAHAGVIGYAGWFTPSSWPGYLFPITLVSFVAGLVGAAAGLRAVPKTGVPS